jgi:hypothetical protein
LRIHVSQCSGGLLAWHGCGASGRRAMMNPGRGTANTV